MKNTLILIIVVLFISCQKQSEFEKTLIEDSENSFWIKKAQDSLGNFNYFSHQFVFNADKTLETLYSKNENIKGKYGNILIEGNLKKSKDWGYFEENNLFFMFPDVYIITKYSKDTIKMNLLTGKKESFILVRKYIK